MSEALPIMISDRSVELPPTAHLEAVHSFAQRHAGGRLPGPSDALEAILLGEEDIRAGRGVPIEESIKRLERIVAKKI